MKKALMVGMIGMASLAGVKAYEQFGLPSLDSKKDYSIHEVTERSDAEHADVAKFNTASVIEVAQAASQVTKEGTASTTTTNQPAQPTSADTYALQPELLIDLAAERATLKADRATLDLQREKLDFLLSSLKVQHEKLSALKGEMDERVAQAKRAESDDLDKLVKIYASMKPAEAAAILDDADIEVAVMVLATMQERISGPILATMQPVRARAISKIILERSRLPADQKLNGIELN